LFHHEFAETADEKVLSPFKSLLADLEKLFHDRAGLAFAQSHIVINIADDLIFGQRHSQSPPPRQKELRVPGSLRDLI